MGVGEGAKLAPFFISAPVRCCGPGYQQTGLCKRKSPAISMKKSLRPIQAAVFEGFILFFILFIAGLQIRSSINSGCKSEAASVSAGLVWSGNTWQAVAV
jgi:hypothetical protein